MLSADTADNGTDAESVGAGETEEGAEVVSTGWFSAIVFSISLCILSARGEALTGLVEEVGERDGRKSAASTGCLGGCTLVEVEGFAKGAGVVDLEAGPGEGGFEPPGDFLPVVEEAAEGAAGEAVNFSG